MSAVASLSKEEIHDAVYEMGRKARAAAHALAGLSAEQKNAILRSMAAELRSQAGEILAENAKDLAAGEANGLTRAARSNPGRATTATGTVWASAFQSFQL